jgi:hypothetical protein
MIPPDLNTVEKFLEAFRAHSHPDGPIINRQYHKNKEFFEKSGIDRSTVRNILLGQLGPQHYVAGPDVERDPHYDFGVIYVFKYQWQEYELYIKLKIIIHKGVWLSYCISFHD